MCLKIHKQYYYFVLKILMKNWKFNLKLYHVKFKKIISLIKIFGVLNNQDNPHKIN